jgi:hypothetical protein
LDTNIELSEGAFGFRPIPSHLIGSFIKREEERCAKEREKGLLSKKKITAFYSHISLQTKVFALTLFFLRKKSIISYIEWFYLLFLKVF